MTNYHSAKIRKYYFVGGGGYYEVALESDLDSRIISRVKSPDDLTPLADAAIALQGYRRVSEWVKRGDDYMAQVGRRND